MATTSGYRVIAMSDEVAAEVRATGKSPGYGHPAHADEGDGPWPCRVCLKRDNAPGERRLLFTYDAFRDLEPLPLPGPVYVHAESCERFTGDRRFPDDLRRVPLTFNAYAQGRKLVAQEYVEDGAVEPVIEALLALPEVAYVHLRHTRAGCYLARVERAA